jgi:hypothetical protein
VFGPGPRTNYGVPDYQDAADIAVYPPECRQLPPVQGKDRCERFCGRCIPTSGEGRAREANRICLPSAKPSGKELLYDRVGSSNGSLRAAEVPGVRREIPHYRNLGPPTPALVADLENAERTPRQMGFVATIFRPPSGVRPIIECLEEPFKGGVDHTRWTERGYVMCHGILYRYAPYSDTEEAQLVVPQSQVPEILREYHDSPLAGHYGVEKTVMKIRQRYFWPTIRQDVAKHVKTCLDCQRYKPANWKPAGLVQTPAMARRFEVLAIDLFGPLPPASTGERWVFAVEDTGLRRLQYFVIFFKII